jgi:arylsulfatase A-like enzyme
MAAKRIGSATADGNNPAWNDVPAERRADLAHRMAAYAGMVTGMDRNVGRLIGDLRAADELENTLILFLSDNGACAEWEPFGFDLQPVPDPRPGTGINLGTQAAPSILRTGDELRSLGGPKSSTSYGSAWANASNTPWRLYKHYVHEGGICTPLVVHWPAETKARGEFRRQVGHLIDVLPTCAAAAGAKYPEHLGGQAILPSEGKSLLPALDDQPIEREYLAWEHEGNAAIRVGDWKLVRQGPAGAWELYDMSRDRTELKNLAAENPQRVRDLAAKWQAWAERTHVFPMPGEAPKTKAK